MVRALGIDPGTGSMDLLLLDDEEGRVLFEASIPRVEVTRDPGVVTRLIERLHGEYGLDSIAAPSGYGIPWVLPEGYTLERAICEATFTSPEEARGHQIHGLRAIMQWLAGSGLPVYWTPGVIHLPTVPGYRKANRIDMGTADKVFTVAASLAAEAERGDPRASNIIVVEAGMAYNAVLAVEEGRIVDGIGGTSGPPGWLGMGAMDAEVAYTLSWLEPGLPRRRLFEGGASAIAGTRSLEELARLIDAGDPRGLEAARALEESIAKAVAAEAAVLGRVDRVYVSGRLFRTPGLAERLARAASRAAGAPVARPLRLGSETKEGATGAALLASGYAGGRYEWLVDLLRLRESRGSVFDHILLDDIPERARRYFCT